jgi:hypothetical protein
VEALAVIATDVFELVLLLIMPRMPAFRSFLKDETTFCHENKQGARQCDWVMVRHHGSTENPRKLTSVIYRKNGVSHITALYGQAVELNILKYVYK